MAVHLFIKSAPQIITNLNKKITHGILGLIIHIIHQVLIISVARKLLKAFHVAMSMSSLLVLGVMWVDCTSSMLLSP